MFHEQFCVILKWVQSIVYVHHVMVKCFDQITLYLAHLVQAIIGLKVYKIYQHLDLTIVYFLGYYGEGAETIDYMLDTVRREVENTDCMQGYNNKTSFLFKIFSRFFFFLSQAFRLCKVLVVDQVLDLVHLY
jgi:hypothetical protein